jgi:hypothetical protein
MKSTHLVIIVLTSLLFVGCMSSSCPPDTVSYLSHPYPAENLEMINQPQVIELRRKEILVDEVITGPVCNDTWSGIIYVTCDIQVPAWDEEAFFFQDCDLDIMEDTVVYVEAHRNKPYSEGCSCHE